VFSAGFAFVFVVVVVVVNKKSCFACCGIYSQGCLMKEAFNYLISIAHANRFNTLFDIDISVVSITQLVD